MCRLYSRCFNQHALSIFRALVTIKYIFYIQPLTTNHNLIHHVCQSLIEMHCSFAQVIIILHFICEALSNVTDKDKIKKRSDHMNAVLLRLCNSKRNCTLLFTVSFTFCIKSTTNKKAICSQTIVFPSHHFINTRKWMRFNKGFT